MFDECPFLAEGTPTDWSSFRSQLSWRGLEAPKHRDLLALARKVLPSLGKHQELAFWRKLPLSADRRVDLALENDFLEDE